MIHRAALNGRIEICQLLIKYIKNKHPIDRFGRTPFHFASINGHFEICQTLGVSRIKDFDQNTSLHIAVQKGNMNICKMIMEEVSVKTDNSSALEDFCWPNYYNSLTHRIFTWISARGEN